MKHKSSSTAPKNQTKLTGYPPYPEDEDIYRKDIETELDPEKIAEIPVKTETGIEEETLKEKKNDQQDELDIPGAENDDMSEASGSEDEENNYYSLGGDNHNDLDEDRS
ncbi:MAG: hypothetical protein J0M37_08205 [Ignavibacteria bacterium]|nr:hypothetical protein [Ignavibacteria bacterium]